LCSQSTFIYSDVRLSDSIRNNSKQVARRRWQMITRGDGRCKACTTKALWRESSARDVFVAKAWRVRLRRHGVAMVVGGSIGICLGNQEQFVCSTSSFYPTFLDLIMEFLAAVQASLADSFDSFGQNLCHNHV